MAAQPPPLEEFRWLYSFPWLRLLSGPGAASKATKLILAVVGLLLLRAGWATLDQFAPHSALASSRTSPDWVEAMSPAPVP